MSGSVLRRCVLVLALLASTVAFATAASTPQAAADEPAPSSSSPSPEAVDSALGSAKSVGRPVEVAGSRSESERTLATPTGTLMLEQFAVPRWAPAADGGWRQIDTSLRRNQDGSVGPVASLAQVRFSGGGGGPLASIGSAAGALSLSWPASLPTPRLDGDTAVYESVLPDVDLRVRAVVDGFAHSLVVKTRAAAENPALSELRFGLSASGLSLRGRPGGGFETTDPAGAVVLSSGTAVMWDSPEPSAAGRVAPDATADAVEETPDSPSVVDLPTTLEDGNLVVRPDRSLLADPGTNFPVVIDPSTTLNKLRWGYADSSDATRDDGIVRVGSNPDGSGLYRSFFAFSISGLRGKVVTSAKFMTTMTHSASCTSTPVNLWRTNGSPTSGKMAWKGPDLGVHIEERSGHAHKPGSNGSCDGDPQPDLPMEFSSGNLKSDVIHGISSGWNEYALALTTYREDGSGESTQSWWKKFDAAKTKLVVEYNTPPNTPTTAQMTLHTDYTAPATACITGTSTPHVRSSQPWLKAVLTDPDGVNGGSLKATFTLERYDGATRTWGAVPGWPKSDSGVPSNSRAEIQVAGLGVDDSVRWHVVTSDTLGGSSSASPWCAFIVDSTPPQSRPSVTSLGGLYPESPPNGTNVEASGGVGVSGRFKFSAREAGITSFVYQIEGGPERVVAAMRSSDPPPVDPTDPPVFYAVVWVTPTTAKEVVLTVRSQDAAGNPSAPYDYRFLVAGPDAEVARWTMDEATGVIANTSPAGGPGLALAGGSGWTASRLMGAHETRGVDSALSLAATGATAATSGPVLDTGTSYSVAAWVRLDTLTADSVAVSQAGTASSAFTLGYAAGTRKWVFTMRASEADAATIVSAESSAQAKQGVWTHLVGVYDAGAGAASLYVDGRLQQSKANVTAWNAGGVLRVGGARLKGAVGSYWTGAVDDVRVWGRVVYPNLDIDPLVAAVPAGDWELDDWDEDAPRQAADESGFGRSATLTDTAHWTADGYNFSTALEFDGQSATAQTAGPVLRTDQSFSIAARLYLTAKPDYATALSQRGADRAAFYLQYMGKVVDGTPVDRWRFVMPTTETSTPVWADVQSTASVPLNTWVHVAAVYDAGAGTLRLYVNGVEQGAAATGVVGWHATGSMYLGGFPTNFFPGRIDRARAWVGTLSAAEISALANEP